MLKLARCSIHATLRETTGLSHQACYSIFKKVSATELGLLLHGYKAEPRYITEQEYNNEKHKTLLKIQELEKDCLVKTLNTELKTYNPVQYVESLIFQTNTYYYPLTTENITAIFEGLKTLVQLLKPYVQFYDSEIVFFHDTDYYFIVFKIVDNEVVKMKLCSRQED